MMTLATKHLLKFLAFTIAGLFVGSVCSAFATALFFPREGSIAQNLGWAFGWLPMIPFVLTFGLPVSLNVIPWLAWPSVFGFVAWIFGGALVVRKHVRIGSRVGFCGSLLWAIIFVPAAKMISSV